MFKKNKCPNCDSKVSKDFEFCPHCGNEITENQEDLGMLGKEDSLNEAFNDPFFGMNGGFLNKMLNNTMKMLEKELQKGMQNPGLNQPVGNFELYINGKKIDPKNIKVSQKVISPQGSVEAKKEVKEKAVKLFNKEQNQKFQELPREEPLTKSVRRLSNRVIYELEIPEVKSVDDVAISRIQNSIEIKAVGKTKSYFKILPVGLPVIKFEVEKGTLTLELGTKD